MNNKHRLMLLLSLFVWLGFAVAVQAQTTSGTLSVQISQESAVLMAGDWVEFTTVLHNDSDTATPTLVAHLNIAAVKEGPYVDPEDWSPQRTQYLPPLAPGESVQLAWRVHTLINGEFAVYVTVVSPEPSFTTAASPSLLVQAMPDNVLPLNQVVPVVAIVPIFPLALLLFGTVRVRRKR